MEAASQAAREAGGRVIGVTLERDGSARQANPHLTREIREPDLLARLRTLICDADIFFAVENGGPGTLNEVFLVWCMRLLGEIPGRPIVLVGPGWRPVLDCLRGHLVLRDGAWDDLTLAPDAAGALAVAAPLAGR
jgi:predicted Rossmann-fold nucleotide-binding protein